MAPTWGGQSICPGILNPRFQGKTQNYFVPIISPEKTRGAKGCFCCLGAFGSLRNGVFAPFRKKSSVQEGGYDSDSSNNAAPLGIAFNGVNSQAEGALTSGHTGYPVLGADLGHDALFAAPGSILDNPTQDALETHAATIIAQVESFYANSHYVTERYTGVSHGPAFNGPTHEAYKQGRRAEYHGVDFAEEVGGGHNGVRTVSVPGDITTYCNLRLS